MFDKYTQINNFSRTEINEYTPEIITLNISNVDKGFFVTCERNSHKYLHLMCENPVILEYESKKISDEDMQWQYGHLWRVKDSWQKIEIKHLVKVINIQYIGNNEFLFNLIKL